MKKCNGCGKFINQIKFKYCDFSCGEWLRISVSQTYLKFRKKKCELCGRKTSKGNDNAQKALQIHHKDGNIRNNKKANLQTVCRQCHWKLEKHFLRDIKYEPKPMAKS